MKQRHEDILPVCDERFVIKDRLLKAAWVVGAAAVASAAGVYVFSVHQQAITDKSQNTKIEAIDQRVPDVSSKLDKIISQNDEIIRGNRINRIRNGIEK